MVTLGSELSSLESDFAITYLSRVVPSDVEPLTTDSRVGFALARTPFSNGLGEATTTIPLFKTNKYGNREIKQPTEIPEALDESHLTDFGRKLKRVISGRIFIDLGCGDPTFSRVPRNIAGNFAATRYVGVDKKAESVGKVVLKDEKDIKIPVTYVHCDILKFLSRLTYAHGIVFYLAGIEPIHSHEATEVLRLWGRTAAAESAEVTHAYILKCMQEIQRVTSPGDIVIIGQATHGFPVQNYGFKMIGKVEKMDSGGNL